MWAVCTPLLQLYQLRVSVSVLSQIWCPKSVSLHWAKDCCHDFTSMWERYMLNSSSWWIQLHHWKISDSKPGSMRWKSPINQMAVATLDVLYVMNVNSLRSNKKLTSNTKACSEKAALKLKWNDMFSLASWLHGCCCTTLAQTIS